MSIACSECDDIMAKAYTDEDNHYDYYICESCGHMERVGNESEVLDHLKNMFGMD